jgi:Flp pilus assembly protein TadG
MLREERRGQALVEFALVVPILVLVMIGLFDVGRAVHGFNTVSNAARAAARVAIVNQTEADIRARAIDMAPGLGLTDADVTLVPCDFAGCLYGVTVTWDYEPVTPLIGNLFHPQISSTAEMVVEFAGP